MMADVMDKISALKSGRGRKNSLSQGSLLHLGGERNKLDESFHSTLDKDGDNEAAYHSPNDDAVDELNFDEFQDAQDYFDPEILEKVEKLKNNQSEQISEGDEYSEHKNLD